MKLGIYFWDRNEDRLRQMQEANPRGVFPAFAYFERGNETAMEISYSPDRGLHMKDAHYGNQIVMRDGTLQYGEPATDQERRNTAMYANHVVDFIRGALNRKTRGTRVFTRQQPAFHIGYERRRA